MDCIITEASQPYNKIKHETKVEILMLYIPMTSTTKYKNGDRMEMVRFNKDCSLFLCYLDKTIMKKKTKGCRNCDKSLLKFLLNNSFNNVFNIGADIGIVVLF